MRETCLKVLISELNERLSEIFFDFPSNMFITSFLETVYNYAQTFSYSNAKSNKCSSNKSFDVD